MYEALSSLAHLTSRVTLMQEGLRLSLVGEVHYLLPFRDFYFTNTYLADGSTTQYKVPEIRILGKYHTDRRKLSRCIVRWKNSNCSQSSRYETKGCTKVCKICGRYRTCTYS